MEMLASEDRIFFMCVVIDSKVVLIIANVIIISWTLKEIEVVFALVLNDIVNWNESLIFDFWTWAVVSRHEGFLRNEP